MTEPSSTYSNREPFMAMVTLTKLKLMSFFETTCTDDEFRFTAGTFTKISWQSLYEFTLVYTGGVFYIAKMVKSGRI